MDHITVSGVTGALPWGGTAVQSATLRCHRSSQDEQWLVTETGGCPSCRGTGPQAYRAQAELTMRYVPSG
jgi:hypothetical protein